MHINLTHALRKALKVLPNMLVLVISIFGSQAAIACECYCSPSAGCNSCCDSATKQNYNQALETICKLKPNADQLTSKNEKKAFEFFCKDKQQ